MKYRHSLLLGCTHSPGPVFKATELGKSPSSDECLLEDHCLFLARNVAELTQGPPVLRQAIKTQELPLLGCAHRPGPVRELLWGDLMAPDGRGEESKVYLDEGWGWAYLSLFIS